MRYSRADSRKKWSDSVPISCYFCFVLTQHCPVSLRSPRLYMSPGSCVASLTDQFKYKPEGCTSSWSGNSGGGGRGTRGRSENSEKSPTPSCARSTLSSTATTGTTSTTSTNNTRKPNHSSGSSSSDAGGQHYLHQSHRQQEQHHQSHSNSNNSSKNNSSNSSSLPQAAPVKGAAPVWSGGASNSICHPIRAPRKKKRLITVTGPRKRAPPPPPPPPPPLPNSTSSSRVHITSPAGSTRPPSGGTRAVVSGANGSREGGDTGVGGGNSGGGAGGGRAAEFMEDNDEICRELRRAHEMLKQADAHALYKIVELQGMYELISFSVVCVFFFSFFPYFLLCPFFAPISLFFFFFFIFSLFFLDAVCSVFSVCKRQRRGWNCSGMRCFWGYCFVRECFGMLDPGGMEGEGGGGFGT